MHCRIEEAKPNELTDPRRLQSSMFYRMTQWTDNRYREHIGMVVMVLPGEHMLVGFKPGGGPFPLVFKFNPDVKLPFSLEQLEPGTRLVFTQT